MGLKKRGERVVSVEWPHGFQNQGPRLTEKKLRTRRNESSVIVERVEPRMITSHQHLESGMFSPLCVLHELNSVYSHQCFFVSRDAANSALVSFSLSESDDFGIHVKLCLCFTLLNFSAFRSPLHIL
jgi:hypothetical protein